MAGKKYPTIKPTDFSKDRIERILAEARGEDRPVPVVSRAPPPISPIRRPSSGMPPELIKQPRKLPTDYPDTLSLRTLAVINEAREKEKFPRRSQLLDFCKEVLANLTPTFCTEVKAARLQGPQALSHLDGLLDSLLLSNEYSEPILADLGQELKRSKEWAAFIRELLRAEQQARRSPQSSQATITGTSPKLRDELVANIIRKNPDTSYEKLCEILDSDRIPTLKGWEPLWSETLSKDIKNGRTRVKKHIGTIRKLLGLTKKKRIKT